MGAAASVHTTNAISTVFQGLILKGQEKLQQLQYDHIDSSIIQLVMLKLGLIENINQQMCVDSTALNKIRDDLFLQSKGEDLTDDSQLIIIEINSNEDLHELDIYSDGNYLINLESCGLPELIISLNTALNDSLKQLKGLNIANNGIEDNTFASLHVLRSTYLMSLHAGGNCPGPNFAKSISNCTQLIILDLSFTENLCISSALGMICPQLIRLVLDGCSLQSTLLPTAEDDSKDEISIFYGLLQLRELSLRENLFEDVKSLKGLSFFSFQDKYTDILVPTLTVVSLLDNPLMEVTSTRKDMEAFILKELPFLSHLNDKSMESYVGASGIAAPSGDLSKILKRDGDGGSAAVGGQEGFENMDKEYLATLKGERDVTIVS